MAWGIIVMMAMAFGYIFTMIIRDIHRPSANMQGVFASSVMNKLIYIPKIVTCTNYICIIFFVLIH